MSTIAKAASARVDGIRGRRGLIYLRNHHFLADPLGPESIVVDLGAHLGEFSLQVHQAFGCRCVAVEANPTLFDQIAASDGIQKLQCAVVPNDGPVSFTIDANPEGGHLASDGRAGLETLTVPGLTLESIKRRMAIPAIDLLKMDVEGSEFDLFDSLSDAALEALPQITVEFHDFIAALNCRGRVEHTKRRLMDLGFACVVFSRANHGDVLFINRRHYRASKLQWFYIEHMARYVRGIERILRRQFP